MELVRRSGWGAAPPKSKPLAIPTPVSRLFLHHSVTPDNGAETVRSIQRFHQDTRGYQDIAYTWLYSPRHRLFFEGRGPAVAGAHTRNYNRTSHAVCVLGNYDVSVPPAHVIQDLADWARWHGTAWGPNQYQPHNAVGETACPGKHLVNVLRDINYAAEEDFTFSSPTPGADLPPTLKAGDRGDDVKLMQAAIMPHDGVFGPQTEAQLRTFQLKHGLTPDGICGPATWRVILSL